SRLSRQLSAQRGAARGHSQARLQSPARARRQYLFPRQARGDRRPFLPVSCGPHDRLGPGGLRADDEAGRPPDRRQSQQGGTREGYKGEAQREVAQQSEDKKTWLGSLQELPSRTCPPSALRSTTSAPRSRTGSASSPVSKNRSS